MPPPGSCIWVTATLKVTYLKAHDELWDFSIFLCRAKWCDVLVLSKLRHRIAIRGRDTENVTPVTLANTNLHVSVTNFINQPTCSVLGRMRKPFLQEKNLSQTRKQTQFLSPRPPPGQILDISRKLLPEKAMFGWAIPRIKIVRETLEDHSREISGLK